MKMKKLTAGLCAVLMMCGVVCSPVGNGGLRLSTAISASAETYGDFEYSVNGNCIEITKYNGIDRVVEIPSEIDGRKVTIIDSSAFSGCEKINKISLPDTIVDIRDYAFYNCSGLLDIKIPTETTTISQCAFAGCSSLKKITIPDSVTDLGNGVFSCCYNLESIELPNSVTYFGEYMFSESTSLKSVVLPDGIESIPMNTFSQCTALKTVTIPESVTSIVSGAFDDCNKLTDIFFKGTKSQWKNVKIDYYLDWNDQLKLVTVHCSDGDITPTHKSVRKAKIEIANAVYTGKQIKPVPTVTIDGKKLKKGTDYSISYMGNKMVGKAKVTIKGKGKYLGSKTASFIIKPKKMTAKKLVSPKKKTVKLTWVKADGNVDGYQILLGTNKKFTAGKKSVFVKKPAAAAKTVKKLKSKKTYYAKVRAFKKVDGKNYFGAWSKIKKVKCK